MKRKMVKNVLPGKTVVVMIKNNNNVSVFGICIMFRLSELLSKDLTFPVSRENT